MPFDHEFASPLAAPHKPVAAESAPHKPVPTEGADVGSLCVRVQAGPPCGSTDPLFGSDVPLGSLETRGINVFADAFIVDGNRDSDDT